ncbi:hypothetical protein TRAPUB_6679 [Trametes pubescens]|uniref:F-box domain-containing protein n=1 Tax=Trametes pubescens TaxID=154538 RepID=A0A1M2V5H4_TRAPU|nr:hypothetical protein TRAPUB_6679 [Trametes pubescens]
MLPLAVQTAPDVAPGSEYERDRPCDFTQFLPVEILAEIFNLVRDDGADDGWQTIAWVDSRWRAVALGDVRLWKRLSLNHKHSYEDAITLLGRSGAVAGLDLTFDLNRLPFDTALWLIWSTQQVVTGDRMRKLTVHARGEVSDSVLFHFLQDFQAPRLESLTLGDMARVRHCTSTEARHRLSTETQNESNTQVRPEDNNEEPSYDEPDVGVIFSVTLPELPELKELRILGYLILAPPPTLAQLTTLELYHNSSWSFSEAARPVAEDYLRTLLESCPNLERLVLDDCIADFLVDLDSDSMVVFPALRYLEATHITPYPTVLCNTIVMPETAAIHLRTHLDPDSRSSAYMLPFDEVEGPGAWHPPSLDTTVALAFHAHANQSVQGWTTPYPNGKAPAWSFTGLMDFVGAHRARELLRPALRDLPYTVGSPRRIVHLEVHLHYTLAARVRAADWRRLLREFPALRVLRIGGERAAQGFLAALPPAPRQCDGEEARKHTGLPPRLHVFELCLDALRGDTCGGLLRIAYAVPVLRIRLPAESRWKKGNLRVKTWAWGVTLAQSVKHLWETRVRMVYGKRCETCQCAEDPSRVEDEDEDEDKEEEDPDSESDEDIAFRGREEEEDGWMPSGIPVRYGPSAQDWELFELDEFEESPTSHVEDDHKTEERYVPGAAWTHDTIKDSAYRMCHDFQRTVLHGHRGAEDSSVEKKRVIIAPKLQKLR